MSTAGAIINSERHQRHFDESHSTKEWTISVQDAVSSRRLVESIEEKYYKFTAAVVIKYKYNTSMLITVWCKDNQILLPIKNANLFIYFYSNCFRWYISAAYKHEHINVEGKAVLGLPSTNCMASPTTTG